MVRLNKFIVEEKEYTKDGVLKKYVNVFLDVTKDEYRYRIPLACSDKGEFQQIFRDVKNSVAVGIYELRFEE